MLESSKKSRKYYAKQMTMCAEQLHAARIQSVKLEHLVEQSTRTVVQCTRILHDAYLNGFALIFPPEFWHTFKPTDSRSAYSDKTCYTAWTIFICPILKTQHNVQKANTGKYEFPKVLTNKLGKALGKDGKVAKVVDIISPDSGVVIGKKLQPLKTELDEYDGEDLLNHWRNKVSDWADYCFVASGLFESTDINTPTFELQPIATSKSGKVILFNQQEAPIVCDQPQKILNKNQHHVIRRLIQSEKNSFTKDDLIFVTKRGGARGTLERLKKRSAEWDKAIVFPGISGGGYSIL